MSSFPDMREKKEEGNYYYQGYLDEERVHYLAGYDYAVEDMLDTFLYNLDVYQDELDECGFDDQRLRAFEECYTQFIQLEGTNDPLDLETIGDNSIKLLLTFVRCFWHWAEMHRDEMGTSLIDSMSDEELKEAKRKYDSGYKNHILRLEEAKQNGKI